nr:50S ribosomal protein L4 [Gemmatimonadota bacterium]NIP77789.1 50S ribosomal protein L4 [Gemmatimonadota bacterium]NIR77092.1 50S ribosomal protein L4 [Gemmatimonadota bacterium]NIU29444.1 50S ribosomal protein L4 [Gemmatimonadota bacterium]NIV59858.1 50S ribosomal protein L4 [Gemmatimonadota bacterium]
QHFKNDGKKDGERELPIVPFDGIVNEPVLHQAVRAYRLNQRQGTASTKTRSEVRGGGRKPWRQKGTGRARHGSIRSPIWAGGGITFGPRPKSWRVDLPRKVKGLARRSALNARAADGRVLIVDDLSWETPKTRRLRELFEAVGAEGKVLLLTDGVNETVYLSGRNMPHVQVMPFGQESAYHVLWATTVVIETPALEASTEAAEEAGLLEKARERIARVEEAEKEAAKAAKKKAKKKPKKKAGKPKAEKKKAAEPSVDLDEIELPIVAELADFLQDFDDPELIRALQERDSRKTAQRHYDARVEELTGDEEDGDG